MNRLAAATVQKGWAAWNIEYRRVGMSRGGWPTTFLDVTAAVEHLSQVDSIDLGRVVTCGHSAGGHLALWAAGRDRASVLELQTHRPSTVHVSGAISLAGIADLEKGAALQLGGNAVIDLLGGTIDQVPDRYRATSPAAMLPLGVPQVLLHGLLDQVVPPQLSIDYVAAAARAGDQAAYVPLEGVAHREVISAPSLAWQAASAHIERLFS
jgi:acetyl esterase/lipase